MKSYDNTHSSQPYKFRQLQCSTQVSTYPGHYDLALSECVVSVPIIHYITKQAHVHLNQNNTHNFYYTAVYWAHLSHIHAAISMLSHSSCLILPNLVQLFKSIESHFLAAIRVNEVIVKEEYRIKACIPCGTYPN